MIAVVEGLIKKGFAQVENGLSENSPYRWYFQGLKQISIVFITIFLFSSSISGQDQLLKYNVVYKGDIIGNMQVNQNKSIGKVNIKMVSNVQMHLIFGIKMYSKEESSFENGRLIYSSVYRQVNGKEKANKQTRAIGNNYQTSSEGIVERVNNGAIEFNVHSLYFHEPVNLQKVYSDNFLQLLPIKKIADHGYKIDLPDGNCNYYYYKSGICNRVQVHTSMVTVEMLLTQ
jgi:hypothetical protein